VFIDANLVNLFKALNDFCTLFSYKGKNLFKVLSFYRNKGSQSGKSMLLDLQERLRLFPLSINSALLGMFLVKTYTPESGLHCEPV